MSECVYFYNVWEQSLFYSLDLLVWVRLKIAFTACYKTKIALPVAVILRCIKKRLVL